MPQKLRPNPASAAAQGPVIAKAVRRAADHLKLTSKVLSGVIGLSEPSISRLRKGEYSLEAGTKPFELAVLLIRLYRSLDAIVGGDEAVARAWLRNENMALGGRPIDRILTVQGLVDVIAYLDARRAPI
jgi:hypothetical protein